MSAPAFAATNQPGTCLWCGRKLRPVYREIERPATPSELAAYQRQHADFAPAIDAADARGEHATADRLRRRLARISPWLQAVPGATGNGVLRVTERQRTGRRGLHDGLFDTRGCAEKFGVALAEHGRRLEPRTAGGGASGGR